MEGNGNGIVVGRRKEKNTGTNTLVAKLEFDATEQCLVLFRIVQWLQNFQNLDGDFLQVLAIQQSGHLCLTISGQTSKDQYHRGREYCDRIAVQTTTWHCIFHSDYFGCP